MTRAEGQGARWLALATLSLFLLLFAACAREPTRVVTMREPVSPNITAIEEEVSAAPTAPENISNVTPAPVAEAAQATRADLELSSLYLSTIYPTPGESFEINLKITNTGSEQIAAFSLIIKIERNGQLIKSDFIDYTAPLAPGASVKLSKQYSLAETGSYRATVKLDPDGKLAEPNELNNIGEQMIVVRQPAGTTTTAQAQPAGPCSDSDGGKVYTLKGNCIASNTPAGMTDLCLDSTTLWEWFCTGQGECASEQKQCVCSEGACVS